MVHLFHQPVARIVANYLTITCTMNCFAEAYTSIITRHAYKWTSGTVGCTSDS